MRVGLIALGLSSRGSCALGAELLAAACSTRQCEYTARWEVVRSLHRAIDGFLARGLCRLDVGTLCRVGRDGRPFVEGRGRFAGTDGEWAISGHSGDSSEHTRFLFDVAFERAPARICEVGFNAGHSAATLLVAAGRNSSYLGFDLSVLNPGTNEELFELFRAWMDPSHRLEMHWGDARSTMSHYLADRGRGGAGCDLLFYDGPHDAVSVLHNLPLLRGLASRSRPLIIIDDVRCTEVLCGHSSFAWDFLVWAGLIKEIRCRSARSVHATSSGNDFGACVGEFQWGQPAASCSTFDSMCVVRTYSESPGGGLAEAWSACCGPGPE